MNRCIESSHSGELDETIEKLVPGVEALLQRIAPNAYVMREPNQAVHELSVPVQFPDGIGTGMVVAKLFPFREDVRIDIEIDHNRVFVGPGGSPTKRRCYLNDFIATVTLPSGADRLPQDFQSHVVSGVHAARQAVEKHNREHKEPWNQLGVVAG